jgi:hypothetical protein
MWRGDKAVGIEFSVAVERHTLSQFIARSSRRPIYRVRGKKNLAHIIILARSLEMRAQSPPLQINGFF